MVGLWKLLYLDRTPITADPAHDEAWNRGHYLVDAVAHCAECHSARNLANAIKESSRFAGGYNQEGVGYVPNLTPASIGGWSRDEMVTLLTDGQTPRCGKWVRPWRTLSATRLHCRCPTGRP
jgi:mono/diheme cytochrome c family protein